MGSLTPRTIFGRRWNVRGIALTTVLASLVMAALLGIAQERLSVDLQQVYVDLPTIVTYLDITSPAAAGSAPRGSEAKIVVADQVLPFSSLVPFEQTGEGVTYAVLIDVSRSIGRVQFTDLQASVAQFVKNIAAKDKMALWVMGSRASLLQDFTGDKNLLLSKLSELKPSETRTALYAGLIEGLRSMRNRPDLPRRKGIVVLTDGKDDDDISGRSRRDVDRAIEDNRVPIFAIGVTQVPQAPNAENPLRIMAEFAAASHGLYRPLGSAPLASTYADVAQRIRRVYVGTALCQRCPHDGREYGLKVVVRGAESGLAQLTLFRSTPETEFRWTPWIVGAAALVCLGALGFWLFRLKRKKEPPLPSAPTLIKPPVIPANWRLTFVFVDNKRGQLTPVDVRGVVTIGKGQRCSVRLPDDASIGEQHCEVYEEGDRLVLRDLGTPGGTIVDNITLTSAAEPLKDGYRVKLGNTLLRVVIEKIR